MGVCSWVPHSLPLPPSPSCPPLLWTAVAVCSSYDCCRDEQASKCLFFRPGTEVARLVVVGRRLVRRWSRQRGTSSSASSTSAAVPPPSVPSTTSGSSTSSSSSSSSSSDEGGAGARGRSGRGRAVVVDEVVMVAQGVVVVAQGVDRGGVDSSATQYRPDTDCRAVWF